MEQIRDKRMKIVLCESGGDTQYVGEKEKWEESERQRQTER